ncbi:GNAT family N-acetyltransferase [Bdellovibrio reynosensis]|uniref:GNAT family N-acetyltransferase n=1 Tax=Bdellovibrio reynosensis TaxID=2835041 RepID=A0ABY4CB08_9BACT|nr:GNAT family N-acetyltransferase [Bdellovibrio reynosensis]UOF02135.1 GNAT family N-acetyltransferase [Bdellovibrio reynosensis]
MQIRPLSKSDLPAVKTFTDKTIGLNYFSLQELQECHDKSLSSGIMCSFVLENESGIQGFRLAYPPGTWSKGKGSKLRSDLWQVPLESVGYFQSLFLADSAQGQGWGPRLSEASIESFKKLNTKAIITHAWKESPNNSSIRYLTKFGFKSVTTHPEYWVDVDYECVLDGKPCRCTAEEMIKYLEEA